MPTFSSCGHCSIFMTTTTTRSRNTPVWRHDKWYTYLPTYFTLPIWNVYHVDIVVLSINWHKTHSNIGFESVHRQCHCYELQKLVLWNCTIYFTCPRATMLLQACYIRRVSHGTIPQHVSFIPKADQLYNYWYTFSWDVVAATNELTRKFIVIRCDGQTKPFLFDYTLK